MPIDKKVIVPALALAVVLGAGVYGISKVSAEENGRRFSMVEKIAEKFGLNKGEVEKVFEENRSEHQAQMKNNFEERLNEAVSKGELTEAQKQLILAKKEEMENEREKNREDHRNLSAEERKNKMEERRSELEKWAKDNGIDVGYLMGMGKMGQKGGHGGGCLSGECPVGGRN
ncbi:MAG: hypothetical protein QG620_80 [Patescibacteria group bacterium]|nr:hypothetical protein [Patescibacteria group bacterium]